MKTLLVSSFLTAGVVASNGASIHTGLLNYWNFDGNANDTAGTFAEANSATVNNGTVNGSVTYVAGQSTGFGQAGNFPGGTGNSVTVPDPGAAGAFVNDIDRTGADLTISIWYRLGNIDNGWQAPIAHGEGPDYRIADRDGSNPLEIAWAGGGNGSDIFSTGASLGSRPGGDGNWHHVVATTAGSSTALYVDGVLRSTGGTGTIQDNGSNQLCIGCNPDAGNRVWNGQIDDIGMWNRALSLAEVQEIYNAGLAGTSLGAIPEPGTGALAAVAGLMLVLRRRRK